MRFNFERSVLRKVEIMPHPRRGQDWNLKNKLKSIFLFPYKIESRFNFERRLLRKVEILAHPRRAKIVT